ncbi:hypothetical protein YC2023_094053 [Brassica napus]
MLAVPQLPPPEPVAKPESQSTSLKKAPTPSAGPAPETPSSSSMSPPPPSSSVPTGTEREQRGGVVEMEPSKYGAVEIEGSEAELSKLRRRCLNPYARKRKKPGSIGTKMTCINKMILLVLQLNKNSDDNASARNEDIMKTKSLHDLTMFKNISFHQGLFLSGSRLGWEYAVSEIDFDFIHKKRLPIGDAACGMLVK